MSETPKIGEAVDTPRQQAQDCDCNGGEQGDGLVAIPHEPHCASLRAPHAPAEVERTREELENAIQAAHEEPNIERLQRLGKTISDCINAYGAACRQQGREEQAKELARLSGELKLTHAHYGTDLKEAQDEIARLEQALATKNRAHGLSIDREFALQERLEQAESRLAAEGK